MKISIAVHGRFHAFDLAAALLKEGVDVSLFTNLPSARVARWFPAERTRSMVWHGVLARAAHKLAGGEPPEFVEAPLKRYFGRWACREQERHPADVAHCWSGIAEESLHARPAQICTVARGSAHIAAQDDLLAVEEERTGLKLERPSAWIIAREQREYALADRIMVPSRFARRTFIEKGVSADKVCAVSLATRATGFTATPAMIQARIDRLRAGGRLRVLYVGTLSFRKGMHDLETVMRHLHGVMEFKLVGPQLAECADFVRQAATLADVEGAVAQADLPGIYAWGDVFILPTIEDGFAVVLAQAQAAGLPILTTENSGGPDILSDGGQGWTVPARDAQAIIERLAWCNDHRAELADMVARLHEAPPHRGWDDVARDFINAVQLV